MARIFPTKQTAILQFITTVKIPPGILIHSSLCSLQRRVQKNKKLLKQKIQGGILQVEGGHMRMARLV